MRTASARPETCITRLIYKYYYYKLGKTNYTEKFCVEESCVAALGARRPAIAI